MTGAKTSCCFKLARFTTLTTSFNASAHTHTHRVGTHLLTIRRCRRRRLKFDAAPASKPIALLAKTVTEEEKIPHNTRLFKANELPIQMEEIKVNS